MSQLPKEHGERPHHLCETCRSIDFKSYFIETSSSKVKDTAFLGTLEEIIDRAAICELCAILVTCVRRLNNGVDPPSLENVKPVKVYLDRQIFCILRNFEIEGQKEARIVINRLIINLEPAIFGNFSKIRFQIHKEDSEIPGFGRLMSSTIDPVQLEQWLRRCENKHSDDCRAPVWLGEPEQPSFLKVIDIEKKCVVSAPPDCRYLALSYVWGDPKQMKSQSWIMKRDNVTNSELDNGLDLELLPQTISDSMDLVSRIGERYLWVDALCIVQDDETEVAEQTARMDLVYACALATIIVAAGSSAEASLPGLRDGSRSISQKRVDIGDGYHLMETVAQGNASHLQNSMWNRRGWTFQERLLSRRAFIFTPEQVYWECEHKVCNEEVHFEQESWNFWVVPQAMDCNDEWDGRASKFSRESMGSYVRRYSKRQFTYNHDALSAFVGILRRMEYRNNERFYWGLPYELFDQALCWKYGSNRRTELCRLVTPDRETYQIPFPSWSWLGWSGYVDGLRFHADLYNNLISGKIKSELNFYRLYADGRVELIADSTKRELVGPFSRLSALEIDGRLRQGADSSRSGLWKVPTSIDEDVIVTVQHSTLESSAPASLVDTGRLVFWTSHATLKVISASSFDMTIEIAGRQVKIEISGGTVLKHIERIADIDNTTISSDSQISGSEIEERNEDLADSHQDADNKENIDNDSVNSVHYFVENGDPSIDGKNDVGNDANYNNDRREESMLDFIVVSRYWPIGRPRFNEPEALNLLIITWSDTEECVAQRVGSAVINEIDWIAADREWKRVILE